MPRDGKATPRLDSQFRLKESTLEEFSTPVTASTSAPSVNPFAGFSLSPLKLASSVSSSTATLESASTTWSVSSQAGMERTFPFGQSSMATSPSSASMTVPNFASLAAEMKGDAVRVSISCLPSHHFTCSMHNDYTVRIVFIAKIRVSAICPVVLKLYHHC